MDEADPDTTKDFAEAIVNFVRQPTLVHAYAALEKYPSIFSPQGESVIEALASASEPSAFVSNSVAAVRICRRARQIGTLAAFAEAMEISAPDFADLVRGLKKFEPYLLGLLSGDLKKKRAIVERQPELVSDPAAEKLLGYMKSVEPEGSGRKALDAHLWLLWRARKNGIEQSLRETFPRTEEFSSDPDSNSKRSRASALLSAAETSGRRDAVEAAVAAWQDVIIDRHVEAETEQRAQDQICLGAALKSRFEHSEDQSDLAQAQKLLRGAMQATSEGTYIGLVARNNLSDLLGEHFESGGDLSDLDEAIELLTMVTDQAPHGSELSGVALNNLANTFHKRYKATGMIDSLEHSIQTYRSALRTAAPKSRSYSERMYNLSLVLVDRFYVQGRAEDLTESLDALERARKNLPTDSARFADVLNSMGRVYQAQFRIDKRPEYLEAAIRSHQEALNNVEPGLQRWAQFQMNLGACLQLRSTFLNSTPDLDAAVRAQRLALRAKNVPAHERASAMAGLANTLKLRSQIGRSDIDLREAIDLYRQSLELASDGNSRSATTLANLANALWIQSQQTGDKAAALEALTAFRDAMAQLEAGIRPVDTFDCARAAMPLAIALDAWSEAAEFGLKGITALGELYRTQLLQTGRQAWLEQAQDVHLLTARALGRIGRVADAIAILEQGRSRGFRNLQIADLAILEGLRQQGRADLVDEYVRAAERFSRLVHHDDYSFEQGPSSRAELFGPRQANLQLEHATRAIRTVAGCDTFMQTLRFEQIKLLANGVPVIYLFASNDTGMAFLIAPGRESPEILELPSLSKAALSAAGVKYISAYEEFAHYPNDASQDAWKNEVESFTRWFWKSAGQKLAEHLKSYGEAVLIPCGPLGIFPIQAAWENCPDAPSGRRYLLDEVTLRFVPSIRFLQPKTESKEKAEEVFAVGDPQPVRAPPLPGAIREAIAVAAAFDSAQVLLKTEATYSAVLEALPRFQAIHLACHGRADFAHPLESGIRLADDRFLTLRELFQIRHIMAQVVVLSACDTALIGLKTPDEAMSLPTGFLALGVETIIAPLWPVPDRSTTILMVRFYELWKGGPHMPARALTEAQQWTRDTTNGEKRRYFQQFLSRLPPHSDSAEAINMVCSLIPEGDDECDFSHPWHWAGFICLGS